MRARMDRHVFPRQGREVAHPFVHTGIRTDGARVNGYPAASPSRTRVKLRRVETHRNR